MINPEMINQVAINIIIGGTVIGVIFEVISLYRYWNIKCGLTAKGIQYLKKYQQSGGTNLNQNEQITRWLVRHFDGEMNDSVFIPKQEGGSLVMLYSPSILGKAVPRSPVHFAPTFLTALGVLGTFAGIYFGLQGVNLKEIQEADTLLKSSTQLLEGMKLAFTTSLWGLGASSLFMLLLAVLARIRQLRRDRLREDLRKIALLQTPGRILSRMDTSSTRDAAEQLGNVADSLAGLKQLNAQEIGQAVATSLETTFLPTLNSLQTEVSSLRESQQEQGQTVDRLVTRLKEELIEPVVERLDESARLTQETSEAVKELKVALGDITTNLSEAIATIQRFQGDTLNELKEFAQSLKGILEQFRSDTEGVLGTVSTEIQQAVAESTQGMEAQREAFAASAEQASTTFRGIREELEQSLTTQAQQQQEMLTGVETRTQQILEQANQAFLSQSQTLETLGTEASQLMNQSKENLLETLTNIDEMLQATRTTVQEELEKFRLEYQDSLKQFFEDQNNLLEETLRKQREELEQVITKLKEVFLEDAQAMSHSIKESMTSIQDATQKVHNLANQTGLTSGERLQQLQEIIREIGSEAQTIDNSYQHLAHQFDQALQKGNEQLMEYLEKANEAYLKNLKDVDQAAVSICSQLNETSHGLMDVSHYLVASAEELKMSNGSRAS